MIAFREIQGPDGNFYRHACRTRPGLPQDQAEANAKSALDEWEAALRAKWAAEAR